MLRFGDPGGRAYTNVGTSQANLLAWWTGSNSFPTAFSVVAGGGRKGGSCLRQGYIGNTGWISKTLDAQATWGISFALKISAYPGFAITMFKLYDGVAMSDQVEIALWSDGTLRATRGGNYLGSTTAFVPINAWTHIEWKVLIHPTAGTVDIRFNGGTVGGLSLTGQNTRTSTNSFANVITFGAYNANQGNINLDFDDIVVYDGQPNDPRVMRVSTRSSG